MMSQIVKKDSCLILLFADNRYVIVHSIALELTDSPHTDKIHPSGKNGYLCAKAETQYATVIHFTNPFSPLLSRWLVKEKKKYANQ